MGQQHLGIHRSGIRPDILLSDQVRRENAHEPQVPAQIDLSLLFSFMFLAYINRIDSEDLFCAYLAWRKGVDVAWKIGMFVSGFTCGLGFIS